MRRAILYVVLLVMCVVVASAQTTLNNGGGGSTNPATMQVTNPQDSIYEVRINFFQTSMIAPPYFATLDQNQQVINEYTDLHIIHYETVSQPYFSATFDGGRGYTYQTFRYFYYHGWVAQLVSGYTILNN
jgi:hypothetical protein